NRVADVEEPPEKLAQLERATAGVLLERLVTMELLDGLLERIAANETHGVVRPAVAVGTEPIHGHNARMLQSPGNLGFKQKPLPAHGIVRVVVQDLLEGHLAVQLAVECDEYRPQATLGVGPQNAESLPVRCGRTDRVIGREISIVAGLGRSRTDVRNGSIDRRIAQSSQTLTGRTIRA